MTLMTDKGFARFVNIGSLMYQSDTLKTSIKDYYIVHTAQKTHGEKIKIFINT